MSWSLYLTGTKQAALEELETLKNRPMERVEESLQKDKACDLAIHEVEGLPENYNAVKIEMAGSLYTGGRSVSIKVEPVRISLGKEEIIVTKDLSVSTRD